MEADILGGGFERETLVLQDDYEGEGIATLIRKRGPKESTKAVLYIHGYVDYFFKEEMAEKYCEHGFNFYALDLRKYGRSLLPHQTPNFCNDISEYFEELAQGIDIIKNRDGNEKLLLHGHSTGSLVIAIYAHQFRHEGTINALFLDSPFFEFNENWIKRTVLMDLIGSVARFHPDLYVPGGLSPIAGESLHRDHHGEWDYNLEWKPVGGFPLRTGWLRAIHNAHKRIQGGLRIVCPILVMYSAQSSKLKKWSDLALKTDTVLDVAGIERYADALGDHVTEIRIPGAMHDLVLSCQEVREDVYRKLFTWLSAYVA